MRPLFSIRLWHRDARPFQLVQVPVDCIVLGVDTFPVGTQLRQ